MLPICCFSVSVRSTFRPLIIPLRDEEVLRLQKADLSMMKDDEWIPAECLAHHSEKRVRLNIGGQV